MIDKANDRYSNALTGSIRKQVESRVPKLLLNVKEIVHDEVSKGVKEWFAFGALANFFHSL